MGEKIFIVEDERPISRLLQLTLEREGFKTATELNGRRAYERILQEKYDLVLLDVMLPEMDGMEICKRVREVSDVPIIMLTARDEVRDKVEGLDLGANDYMTCVLLDQSDVGIRTCEIDLEACLSSSLVSCHSEFEALLPIKIRFWINDQEWSFCFCHGCVPLFPFIYLVQKHAMVPLFEFIIVHI